MSARTPMTPSEIVALETGGSDCASSMIRNRIAHCRRAISELHVAFKYGAVKNWDRYNRAVTALVRVVLDLESLASDYDAGAAYSDLP